jgi:hypothetical protein
MAQKDFDEIFPRRAAACASRPVALKKEREAEASRCLTSFHLI